MKQMMIFLASLVMAGNSYGQNAVLDSIQEYLDFAEYSEGSISTQQLAATDADNIFYIDTRSASQFQAGHIPDAINIEWRQILIRKDEIPSDQPVVLYCETGLLSSKAQFILRLAGYDNVKVLWGGYLMWSARQSFEDASKHTGKTSDLK